MWVDGIYWIGPKVKRGEGGGGYLYDVWGEGAYCNLFLQGFHSS